jgi:hypothetical protein
MDRKNLPLAGECRLRPDAKAFDEEAAFVGTVTVSNDELTGFPLAHRDRKRLYCRDILRVESRNCAEPSQQGRQYKFPIQPAAPSRGTEKNKTCPDQPCS